MLKYFYTLSVVHISLKAVLCNNCRGSEYFWISKGFSFGTHPSSGLTHLCCLPKPVPIHVLEMLLQRFERAPTKPKTFYSSFFQSLQAFQVTSIGWWHWLSPSVNMADSQTHPWPFSQSILASWVSPSGLLALNIHRILTTPKVTPPAQVTCRSKRLYTEIPRRRLPFNILKAQVLMMFRPETQTPQLSELRLPHVQGEILGAVLGSPFCHISHLIHWQMLSALPNSPFPLWPLVQALLIVLLDHGRSCPDGIPASTVVPSSLFSTSAAKI